MSLLLLAASLWAGAGCKSSSSSSSGTDPSTGLRAVSAAGHAILPTGVSMTGLVVHSLFSESAVQGDGSFNVVTLDAARSLAVANGPSGEPVLLGFLKQGDADLTVHTTAAVMAYTALAVGVYLEAEQEACIEALLHTDDLSALEQAISAALTARGEGWLDPTDANLSAALAAATASHAAVSSSSSQLRASTRLLGAGGARSRFGAIVDPADRVSGLQVVADGVGSAVVTNAYRRRAYLYVDRIRYKDADGNSVDVTGQPVQPRPIKIDAVKGLDSTIKMAANLWPEWLLGGAGNKDYYQSTSTSPIAVPVSPSGAKTTTYSFTAVGLGGQVTGGADLASLTSEETSGLYEVAVTSVVSDLVLPMITNIILPMNSKMLDAWQGYAGATGVMRDMLTLVSSSPDIQTKLQKGQVASAALDGMMLVVNSQELRKSMIDLLAEFMEATYAAFPSSQYHAGFTAKASEKLLGCIGVLDVGLRAFDTGVQVLDIANSHLADAWTVEVTNATAKLNPTDAKADSAGLPVAFTASVGNADASPGTLFTYYWLASAQFGDISDGNYGHPVPWTGGDSSSNVLSYVPNGKGTGGDMDTVTVQIYKGGINDTNRLAIGMATSLVTINPETITLSPADQTIGEETTLTLQADVVERQSKDAWYEWTVTGGHGTVDGATTVETRTPSVTYVAGKTAGADTVTVAVLSPVGTLRASGSTTVTVDPNPCRNVNKSSTCCAGEKLPANRVCCDNFQVATACCGPTGSTIVLAQGNQCCTDGTQGTKCCGTTACTANPWAGRWGGLVWNNCTSPFQSGLEYDISITSDTQFYVFAIYGAGDDEGTFNYAGNQATSTNGAVKLTLDSTASPPSFYLDNSGACMHGTLTLLSR